MTQLRIDCVRMAIDAGAGNDVCEVAKQIESFISSASPDARELPTDTPHKYPITASESAARLFRHLKR